VGGGWRLEVWLVGPGRWGQPHLVSGFPDLPRQPTMALG